jgi:hypothetical protein
MKLPAVVALVACLFVMACIEPSSASAPRHASVAHACTTDALTLTMFIPRAHSSPFVELNVRTSDMSPRVAVMELDTGTPFTTIDRDFARRALFSNPESCLLSGQLQLGLRHRNDDGYVNSSFFVNRSIAGCGGSDVAFTEEIPGRVRPIKQDGIIGVDWLRHRAFRLNFETDTVTIWDDPRDFAQCSLSDYEVVPFIDGPAVGLPTRRQPPPKCAFRDTSAATACAAPYLSGSLSSHASTIHFPIMMDTGREAGWPELLSVNSALLSALLDHGLVQGSSCGDGAPTTFCDLGVYTLRPGVTFEGGGLKAQLGAVEVRAASHGPPYDQSVPLGLVGMELFAKRGSVIFDPFRGRLLLK